VVAPLPPHMENTWQTLRFREEDGRSPFPPKKHEHKKAEPKPAPRREDAKKPMQKARRKATSTGRKRK
jgi:hypothetical protein